MAGGSGGDALPGLQTAAFSPCLHMAEGEIASAVSL